MHRGHTATAAIAGERTTAARLAGRDEPVHDDPGRGQRDARRRRGGPLDPVAARDRAAARRRSAAACCWPPGGLTRPGPGGCSGRRSRSRVIAVLTGGLHLDGLADTADGLGSRRPAADALAIMRRSDIGPMGVGALVLVLLVQVTAVAALPRLPLAVAALVACRGHRPGLGRRRDLLPRRAAGRVRRARRRADHGGGPRAHGRRAGLAVAAAGLGSPRAARRSRRAGWAPTLPACSPAGCCSGRRGGGSAG